MNIIDIAILALFALFFLSGWYRGFLSTVLSIGSFLVSWVSGMLFLPLVSRAIMGHERLFNMMLYYTEGSEYIGSIEYANRAISSISAADLSNVVSDANLPYPMGKAVTANIAREAFAADGITTLGDYFNQTIVSVAVNILSFLIIFAVVRLILAFVIHCVDHARPLPVLRMADGPIGAGFGLLRGMLAVFVLFMLAPLAMTILPEQLNVVIEESFFAPFFYRSNFLLGLIPGT